MLDGEAWFLFGGSVAGGVTGCGVSVPINTTDRTWFYDVKSSSWTETLFNGSKPPKLALHAGIYIAPYFYSMGGFEFQCENNVGGPKPSTVTYRYQVVTPSLRPTMAPTSPPTPEPDDDILGDTQTSGIKGTSFRLCFALALLPSLGLLF